MLTATSSVNILHAKLETDLLNNLYAMWRSSELMILIINR